MLESKRVPLLFHGHTHTQTVWQCTPSGRLRPLPFGTLSVARGNHYIVGVGSVGLPQDGGWAAYVLYDSGTATIEHVRLSRRFFPTLL